MALAAVDLSDSCKILSEAHGALPPAMIAMRSHARSSAGFRDSSGTCANHLSAPK